MDFPCAANFRLEWLHERSQEPVHTKDAPAAIGPYSQAVRVGDLLFTSGQVALDPDSGLIVQGGIAEQTTRVLDNLSAVLAAAGSSLQNVVKTVVFLKNIGDFASNERNLRQVFRAGGSCASGSFNG